MILKFGIGPFFIWNLSVKFGVIRNQTHGCVLEVLEFHINFMYFGGLIHGFGCYFDGVIVRASSCYIFRLVFMVGMKL